MDEKVLRPVLHILLRCRPVRVPVDPVADVLGKPFVEFVEVLRHDEPVVPDVPPVNNRERIGLSVFNRKIGEIDRLIFELRRYCSAWRHFLSKGFELHASKPKRSRRVGGEGSAGVGAADQEGSRAHGGRCDRELGSHAAQQSGRRTAFTLKLGSFGKFSVRHKPGILRKIPFTGETILTKDRRKVRFVSLGSLRQCETGKLR